MKVFLYSVVLFLCSSICSANSNIAVGFGQPYGGLLGLKLSHSDDQNRYYISLGSFGPIGLGYGIGYDRVVFNKYHSLGLFLGVVGGSESSGTKLGPMINYEFYSSGFNEPSWVFGLGAGYGKDYNDKGSDQDSGAFLFHIGYQF